MATAAQLSSYDWGHVPKKKEPVTKYYLVQAHDKPGRPTLRIRIDISMVSAAERGDMTWVRNLCIRYGAATGLNVPKKWGAAVGGLSVVEAKDQSEPPPGKYDAPKGRPRGSKTRQRS